ncbi:MAG: hypothetical protein M3680_08730 [Myxococcota bacterium]|nr:hypothetical protein [Myxococcota bacterium]
MLVASLLTGGCNAVFGLGDTAISVPGDAVMIDGDPRVDLDRDDIKDISDTCIAPAADGLVDSDRDGIANRDDGCPFDAAHGGDADRDGVPDACDPSDLAGDRVRCVMAFRDPDLNFAMWKPRSPVATWITTQPSQLTGSGSSGIVADWPFEGPAVTTYVVRGVVGTEHASPAAASPCWYAPAPSRRPPMLVAASARSRMSARRCSRCARTRSPRRPS